MSSQKINLLAVSTSKKTDAILNELVVQSNDEIELSLHFGSKNAHIKATSFSRVTPKKAKLQSKHTLKDSSYYGGAHRVIEAEDFHDKFALFMEHLHRDGKAAKFRAHALETIHDYYDYYHVLLDHFSSLIDDMNITHTLFFNVPHLTYDTVLYQLVQERNIPITIVSQSLIPNKFFSLRNVDSFGRIELKGEYKNKVSIQQEPEELFYMSSIKQGERRKGSLTFKSVGNILLHTLYNRPAQFINPLYLFKVLSKARYYAHQFPDWRDPFARFFNDSSFEYLEYLLEFENKKIDWNQKFVYFPLHLQPEMTTSSLGEIYRDQALAIERLSHLLPDDIKIYVKENPKQAAYMRGPLFFYRLKRLVNVEFLPSYISTHDLMKRCEFLATITGTAGWEAIQQGKKAVVFGNAWYKSLPGVIQYKRELTYKSIKDHSFSHEELECAYSEFIERLHTGVVDRHYTKIVPDFNTTKNNQKVALQIYGFLTGNKTFFN